MKSTLLLPLLFCLVSFSVRGGSSNDTLKIRNDGDYKISGHLKYFVVGNKPVNASQAYLYYTANKFLPVKNTNNEYINNGLVTSDIWYALSLQNVSPDKINMVAEFIISRANDVSCYIVDDLQQINFLASSINHTHQLKEGLLSTSIVYNIDIPADDARLLLFHCVNNGYMYYIPANIYNTEYFRERDVYKNNFLGVIKGIFLFIILFNLVIYLSTFDKMYLYYLLYAFCIGIFALNDAGAISSNSAIPGFMLNISEQSFLFFGFAFWLLLMEQFIRLDKNNTFIYRIIRILVAADLVFALFPYLPSLIHGQERKIFQLIFQNIIRILYAINLLLIIIINTSRMLQKNKLAAFYAAANVPVIIGTFLYYSNYYKITDIQFGWLNPLALGLSIETFILSFGFAFRFNLINKEKTDLLLQVNRHQGEVTKQIIIAQENERKRIAEDLHDELGSNLAAIKLSVQKLPVEKNIYTPIVKMLDEASSDVRNISHNLMPPEFSKTKLNELLTYYYNQLSNEGDIKFNFHCLNYREQFNKNDELMIYRIIMEITNNIIKHSGATESTIQLLYNKTYLEIIAEDNGKGFSAKENDGIGLISIRSRIEYLGGNIIIDSGNSGTTTIIYIPFKK